MNFTRLLFALIFFIPWVWSHGLVVREANNYLSTLTFSKDKYTHLNLASVPLNKDTSMVEGLSMVSSEFGGSWNAIIEPETGRIALIEGSGIPWIPGNGNKLSYGNLKLMSDEKSVESYLVSKCLNFIYLHREVFPVDGLELSLSEGSGIYGGYYWTINFDLSYKGIPIEGADIYFRINNGNLVQFGSTGLYRITIPDGEPINTATIREIFSSFIGGLTKLDNIVEQPTLKIMLFSENGVPIYKQVYESTITRENFTGTFQIRIDAQTGEVLSFEDLNRYGTIKGGIYPESYRDTEITMPFPFADYGSGEYANPSGFYIENSNGTSTLSGQYIKVNDNCGSISLTSTSVSGDIDFGKSTGTDCYTPGYGGIGNTHASRSSYYHLTLIKMKALTYLPNNSWLEGRLVDNVNIDDYCNAYYSGTLNFFKSGSGCANTGELSGVFLHEWGHGLDDHDGSTPTDSSSGEAYGDITAFLQTHDSCMGTGFFKGSKCDGYGNGCKTCDGVRDVDYAKHWSQVPATPAVFVQNNCGSGNGPCGEEGHCGSYVITEAVWDLANRDLPAAGIDQATSWLIVDRLWYLSRKDTKEAYTCNLPDSNGCDSSNLFQTFRAVDDDNGNLSDGTPHAGAIFSAFNRHGIACGSESDTYNQNSSACQNLEIPAIFLVTSQGAIGIEWSSISGANGYNVYRNEFGCDAGYTLIGSVSSSSTTFYDPIQASDVTYYYRITPLNSQEACMGAMSNCVSGTPILNCGDSSVFGPSFPCNGMGVNLENNTPNAYYWYMGSNTKFQVEFSDSPSFSKIVSSKTTKKKWLKTNFYTPSSRKLNKIKSLSGNVVYWRIRSKTGEVSSAFQFEKNL